MDSLREIPLLESDLSHLTDLLLMDGVETCKNKYNADNRYGSVFRVLSLLSKTVGPEHELPIDHVCRFFDVQFKHLSGSQVMMARFLLSMLAMNFEGSQIATSVQYWGQFSVI